jgi:hypothetical protein
MVQNGEGIKGLEVIGADIIQMHVKNGRKLIEDQVWWTGAKPSRSSKSGYQV